MRAIKVTLTTVDGEVLDQFKVTRWRENTDLDDEGVGSTASESLLVHRIKRSLEAL